MKYDDVLAYFGGRQWKIANALGVTPPTISQWKGKVPLRHQFAIEVLTKGELKVDQDLLPEELRRA